MANFYLVTEPKYIVSIVATGSMPDNLPIEQQMLTCVATDNLLQMRVQEINNPHATFILEINLSGIANDFSITPDIQNTCISRIIVLSRPGFDTVSQLFQGSCPKPIELIPNFHIPAVIPATTRQALPSFSAKRPWQGQETKQTTQPSQLVTCTPVKPVNPSKGIRGFFNVTPKPTAQHVKREKSSVAVASTPLRTALAFSPVINSPIGSISPAKKARRSIKVVRTYLNKFPGSLLDLTIERITNTAAGKTLLSKVFQEAKLRIILACTSISHEQLTGLEFYHLIPEARKKGVKITIYYDAAELDDKVTEFFIEQDVKFIKKNACGDWLIADHHFMGIGTVTWQTNITDINENNESSASQDSNNSSGHIGALIYQSVLELRGNACEPLIDDVLICFEQKNQSETVIDEDVSIIEPEVECLRSYVIDNKSELRYLATVSEHREFFCSVFEAAKERIIICLTGEQVAQIHLNQSLINRATSRGVEMYFVCEAGYGLENFIAQFDSPKVTIIPCANLKSNTIIIDDNTLTEGCFSWRFVSSQENAIGANHYLSIVVKGFAAKNLINQFFTTPIGDAVNQGLIEQMTSPNFLTLS